MNLPAENLPNTHTHTLSKPFSFVPLTHGGFGIHDSRPTGKYSCELCGAQCCHRLLNTGV